MVSRPSLAHYLISIRGTTATMHAYMMCPEAEKSRLIQNAASRLLNEAEKINVRIAVPIVLATNLNPDGIAKVRAVIEQFPNVTETLSAVEDFHITVWSTLNDCGDDGLLMALH